MISQRIQSHAVKISAATYLDLGVLGKVSPRLPVVLVEGVLDRDNVVLLDELVVDTSELFTGEPLRRVRVGVLEAEHECVISSQISIRDRSAKSRTYSRSYFPSL